jgi:transcriptional regulator NrdR family protein
MPKLEDLFKDQYARGKKKRRGKKGPQRDAVVTGHIRSFIQRDAKPEDVDKIAKQIEDRVKKQPKAAADVAFFAGVVLRQGYGTKRAQEIAKRWVKQYKPADKKPKKE